MPSNRQLRTSTLVVSSYGLLHRDLPCLQRSAWGGVILDEAQNIKNPYAASAGGAEPTADCASPSTGTPVENHVGDLWSFIGIPATPASSGRASFAHLLHPDQRQDAEAADRLPNG